MLAHGDRTGWLTTQSSCEPISERNSLLTGKITGNFAKSGRPPRFSCLIGARIQELAAEFPTQRNREFLDTYQGMFFEEQGILIAGAAKPGPISNTGRRRSKLVRSDVRFRPDLRCF